MNADFIWIITFTTLRRTKDPIVCLMESVLLCLLKSNRTPTLVTGKQTGKETGMQNTTAKRKKKEKKTQKGETKLVNSTFPGKKVNSPLSGVTRTLLSREYLQ